MNSLNNEPRGGAAAEEDVEYELPSTTRRKRGWMIVSAVFATICLALAPVFYVVFNDWNAGSWSLVTALVCFALFAERFYRYRCHHSNKLPHDHIRPLLFFGVFTVSSAITGLFLYIALSVILGRTFFPDGYSLSIVFSTLALFWAIVLIIYTRRFHNFRKQNLLAYRLTLLYCTLGTLVGLTFLIVFLTVHENIPAALLGAAVAFLALLMGAEFKYRHYSLQRNKATHNHLRLLLFIGLIGWLVGKMGVIFFVAVSLRDNEEWTPESHYLMAIAAGLTELFGFSLMYTVWHFRYTEVSVDLFFKTSINDSSPLMDSDLSDDGQM